MPPTTRANEAFSRVVIDDLLKDVGWNLADGHSVRYEYTLPDGTRADYVLCDRHGCAMAVLEAKRSAVNPADAADQGRAYAEQLDVPYVFWPTPVKSCFGNMRLKPIRVLSGLSSRNPILSAALQQGAFALIR